MSGNHKTCLLLKQLALLLYEFIQHETRKDGAGAVNKLNVAASMVVVEYLQCIK
jgi:hypothetical protein